MQPEVEGTHPWQVAITSANERREALQEQIFSGKEESPARLRDLDWRFLLPTPPTGGFHHLVLLGGPAGLPELIVKSGIAQSVSCELPGAPTADAVVILYDAQLAATANSVAVVAGCLLPGGVLYWEIERQRPLDLAATPGPLCRRLQRAGLSLTGCYWIRPHFASRQMYLPLYTEALHWYLDSLFVAKTPLLRLLEPALRFFVRRSRRGSPVLARCYSVTAVAPPAHGAIPSVLADPALPHDLGATNALPVLLTAGADDFNRVILLPFTPQSRQPAVVLKLSRDSVRNLHTENEQVVLAALREKLTASMQQTLPQPLGTYQWSNLSVGIESCVPGRLLLTSTGRWGAPLAHKLADLRCAVTWLTDFHGQMQIRQIDWNDSAIVEWVEGPLAAYQQAFGLTPEEAQLFAAARQCASALIGTRLPVVWEHYAFGDWNIYRDGQQTYVIDWEGGNPNLPLFDLFYLVTHWTQIVRDLTTTQEQLRGFQELFVDRQRTPLATAVHELITHYLHTLAMDERFYPLLLVLMWVMRALSRFDRQVSLHEAPENLRAANQYIKYITVLAAQGEQLFGTSNLWRRG